MIWVKITEILPLMNNLHLTYVVYFTQLNKLTIIMRETKRANKDGKLLLYPDGKPSDEHFIISAWNAGGLKASAYDNAVNHKMLITKLSEANAITGSAEVFDSEKSWRMNGFYVTRVSRDEMIAMAKSLGVHQFYFIDEEGHKETIFTR